MNEPAESFDELPSLEPVSTDIRLVSDDVRLLSNAIERGVDAITAYHDRSFDVEKLKLEQKMTTEKHQLDSFEKLYIHELWFKGIVLLMGLVTTVVCYFFLGEKTSVLVLITSLLSQVLSRDLSSYFGNTSRSKPKPPTPAE